MSSKQVPAIISSSNTTASTPHDTDLTPSPTSSDDRSPKYNISITMDSGSPETVEEGKQKDELKVPVESEPSTGAAEVIQKEASESPSKHKVKCPKAQNEKQKKGKKIGKKGLQVESESSDSSSENSTSNSDTSSDSDSDEEEKKSKRQKAKWKQASRKKIAKKMAQKYKRSGNDSSSSESGSSSDSSDSDSSSSEDAQRKRRKRKIKKVASDESEEEAEVPQPKLPVGVVAAAEIDTGISLKDIAALLQLLAQRGATATRPPAAPPVQPPPPAIPPAPPRTRRELLALQLAKQKELAETSKVCYSHFVFAARHEFASWVDEGK